MTRGSKFLAMCAAALAVGCSDATQPIGPGERSPSVASATRTPGGENFVAIGTSISMGWASNGVYSGSQIFAWPALMRFGSGGPISLPLIAPPGCQSPLIAPLGANLRLSGEGFGGSSVCAPNEAGVQLPTQDVALAGSLTSYALFVTPQIADGAAPWFARVLPPGATQVSAALSQSPTLLSIELGGNDVLSATSGLVDVALNGNVTPVPAFEQAFDGVLGATAAPGRKGLIVGVPTEGRNFPLLRSAAEIWADAAEFAALHVNVSSDCNGSPNYVNASVKSIILVFTAAFTSTHGLPNPVFSCADIPGTEDLVLTPADIATVNSILAQMANHQKQQAEALGYAFFSLNELYGRPGLKPRVYSVISQLTSAHPYGPYISLDGLHPSPLGQSILAKAAAQALNKAYPGIAAHSVTIPPAFGEQLVEPNVPLFGVAWAKQVARQNRGQTMPTCMIPGGCVVRMPQSPR
jgi:lysophospholipase L1-like esterase